MILNVVNVITQNDRYWPKGDINQDETGWNQLHTRSKCLLTTQSGHLTGIK